MKVSDFDYNLPQELIAQTPLVDRSSSRLLVLNKEDGSRKHEHFFNIIEHLNEGDVLVLNDTKVLPSRIYGEKVDTKAYIEVLLLKETAPNVWKSLVKPARRVHEGTVISFKNGELLAKCIGCGEDGERTFEMIYDGIFIEILESIGTMPLPPYIREKLENQDRYQTVYANEYGSAAAPTAGLHFTKELLEELKNKKVEVLTVTLNVGLGTFRPVSVDTVEEHHMHSEFYQMNDEVAKRLNLAKKEGRRIICVGTTSLRTLESIYAKYGEFKGVKEDTNIFIYPPYKIKSADALITNFHLPKSTLIMLVSAFAGYDNIMRAYNEAVEMKYRFFSFGDAMFIC